jgi:Zn finger protein HypA/HybF involved in hydrogenase expression
VAAVTDEIRTYRPVDIQWDDVFHTTLQESIRFRNVIPIDFARIVNVTDTATPPVETEDDLGPIMRAVVCNYCGNATGEFAERQPSRARCSRCTDLPEPRRYYSDGGSAYADEIEDETFDHIDAPHCEYCGSTEFELRVYGRTYVTANSEAQNLQQGDTIDFTVRRSTVELDEAEMYCANCERHNVGVEYDWDVVD